MPGAHSKSFYYLDGSIVIQVGEKGTLYKVHLSLLAERSEVFRDMALMPPPVEGQDGVLDERPMVLPPYISEEEVDCLFAYLFKPNESPEEKTLIAILKLGTMWEMEDARTYAVEMLDKAGTLGTAHRFYLARTYHIDKWVEPAFRELMVIPTSQISDEMAHLIGPDAFYVLANTQAQIAEHRLTLAFYPSEAVINLTCSTPLRCEVAWATQWWQGLAKHLLHPDHGLSGRDALAMLYNVRIPGMCSDCQRVNVDWVKEKGVLTRDEGLFEEAVEKVVSWYVPKAAREVEEGMAEGIEGIGAA